jgi:hypothetical protein
MPVALGHWLELLGDGTSFEFLLQATEQNKGGRFCARMGGRAHPQTHKGSLHAVYDS